MTREEQTAHAHDISNKYVPRISPDDTDVMEEIKKLPIQDIITIYSNARYALENGMFHDVNMSALEKGEPTAKRYVDAIERVKSIVIDRLKSADMLWTVTDKITNLPFIDDIDQIWVFTEKDLADECVDYFMQQYRMFVVTEIPKDEVVKFFAQTAYMNGARYFRIDIGGYAGMKLDAEWIVEKPDFSNVPSINRPIMNPDYVRSLAKYREERLYRLNYEGKEAKIHRFEDDVIKTFHDAKFLLPVKGMKQIINGALPTGSKISIPALAREDGDNKYSLTPVFTDWKEFNKMYSQDEWGGWIYTAQDLLSVPDEIICVNAGSLRYELPKGLIKRMLDIYEKEFAHPKTGGSEAVTNALNALKKEE